MSELFEFVKKERNKHEVSSKLYKGLGNLCSSPSIGQGN
jgi:hypothetical protein